MKPKPARVIGKRRGAWCRTHRCFIEAGMTRQHREMREARRSYWTPLCDLRPLHEIRPARGKVVKPNDRRSK